MRGLANPSRIMFTEFGIDPAFLICFVVLAGLLTVAFVGTICALIGVTLAKIIIAIIQYDLRRVRINRDFIPVEYINDRR